MKTEDALRLGEGARIEFKQSITKSVQKDMCAFLNSQGGTIFVGVSDTGDIIGADVSNENRSNITDYAYNIEPSFTPEITVEDSVLRVDVPEGENKPYCAKGQFYKRIGATSQKIGRDEIKALFVTEGEVQFDTKISPTTLNDLSREEYSKFLEAAGYGDIPFEEFLDNTKLRVDDGLTYAAVILFGEEPKLVKPTLEVTCVVYQGTSKILDKKVFSSGLLTTYQNVVSYLQERLQTEYVITDVRDEYLELPIDALREAVLNAIGHRDYVYSGHVQVDIYKDRVEIQNPARYPPSLTTDELVEGSFPRNPFLFSFMERANLVEKAGSGMKRIYDAMDEYRLGKPTVTYSDLWFTIEFERPDLQTKSYQQRFQKTAGKTAGKTEKVLTLIKENPSITQKELAKLLDITSSGVRYHMKKLQEQNKIKRKGSDKKGKWIVKE